jgi:uncharacterized protein with PQ loop repeat
MIPSVISILAPTFSCIQLFPQLYKTYITKNVRDISFYSLLLITVTNILWLLHGYYIFDYSLIIAGIISLIVNISLLILYLLYSKFIKL